MAAVVLRLRMLPGESLGSFVCRRQQRTISIKFPHFKGLSYICASGVDTWALHMSRNTNNPVWPARTADFRKTQELEARRLANPNCRPDTRVCSGFTAVRWYESIDTARNFSHVENKRSEC